MKDIRLNLRIILVTVVAFLLNKFVIRPYVLKVDAHEIWSILVLSFPNFCEAICGTLLLMNIALVFNKKRPYIKTRYLYHIIPVITATYVILQELKVHNLGGNNVYDPFDLLFSILGIVFTYGFLLIKRPVITLGPLST